MGYNACVTVLVLLGIAVLASCSREPQAATDQAEFEIDKHYERGPISVELKVSKQEITIADRITLVLQTKASEQYEVELPKFGEKLEQFGIVDYQSPPPRLGDQGQIVTRKSYVLEPFLSGKYKIPPMKVTFWKADEENPTKHEIETEELTVSVKSLLPEKAAELEIRDIAGPVELPKPRRAWLYGLLFAGAALAVGLSALALWLRRRRRRAPTLPQLAAHELAYRQLEKLLAEKLLERGEIKPFYQGVSDVLRRYVENRFGLHAPERTTEEFLHELRTSDALSTQHRGLLREFLCHCDLVKFAELKPEKAEIQRMFDACKRFIAETQSEEAKVPQASAA